MRRKLHLKVYFTTVLALILWTAGWAIAPVAVALTQIRLFDIDYHDCPASIGQGVVTSDGSSLQANCFIVTGKAENTSGRTVYNADIFGRIFDANNDPAMQNRNRLGAIAEVPPGISPFELRISVAANQPTPLRLERFKAAGFTGTVRR
jgi:hypothetical protein